MRQSDGGQRQPGIVVGDAEAFTQCFGPAAACVFIEIGAERADEHSEADLRIVAVSRAGFQCCKSSGQRSPVVCLAVLPVIVVDFGEQYRQCPAAPQHGEKFLRRIRSQGFRQFRPDPFRYQVIDFAIVHHLAHQGVGAVRNLESRLAELCREARHAQDTYRVFGEGRADVAQQAELKVLLTMVGIDECAVGCFGDGVDGQVAALQVLFQCDIGAGVKGETFITGAGFAFGTCQRVLLTGFRVQEYREALADLFVTLVQHGLRRRTDHNPVFFPDRQVEQFVAHRTTYQVCFHQGRRACAW